MNRFGKGGNAFRIFKKLHLTFIAFLAAIVLVVIGLSMISQTTDESRRESLETALRRDVMHCYALEGTYPPSLEYIKEHYGLIYDENSFFVDYQIFGANMMPDITIVELKK